MGGWRAARFFMSGGVATINTPSLPRPRKSWATTSLRLPQQAARSSCWPQGRLGAPRSRWHPRDRGLAPPPPHLRERRMVLCGACECRPEEKGLEMHASLSRVRPSSPPTIPLATPLPPVMASLPPPAAARRLRHGTAPARWTYFRRGAARAPREAAAALPLRSCRLPQAASTCGCRSCASCAARGQARAHSRSTGAGRWSCEGRGGVALWVRRPRFQNLRPVAQCAELAQRSRPTCVARLAAGGWRFVAPGQPAARQPAFATSTSETNKAWC